MANKQYTDEFKLAAVRSIAVEGRPVVEVARELGVSASTLYQWRLQSTLFNSTGAPQPGRADDAEEPETEFASPAEGGVAVAVREKDDATPSGLSLGDALRKAIAALPIEYRAGSEPVALPEPKPRNRVADLSSVMVGRRGVTEIGRRSGNHAVTPYPRRFSEGVDVGRLANVEDAPERNGGLAGESGIATGMARMRTPLHPSPSAGPQDGERNRDPKSPSTDVPDSAPSITDLFQAIDVFKRHARLILATTVIGTAAAGVLVALEVPKYRATAVLRVGEAREAVTQGIESPTRETDRYVNPLLSTIQLLRSRSLLGEVVDDTGLRLDTGGALQAGLLQAPRVASMPQADTLWLEFGPRSYSVRTHQREKRAPYGQRVEIAGVGFALTGRPSADRAMWRVRPREQSIDGLLRDLTVSPRDQTNVVDVSFVDTSPHTSQTVVNALVHAYQEFEATSAQERASRRRVFLEEQVAENETRLAEARRALSAFQTRSRSYDAQQELAAQQQNRMLLDMRVSELDAERRMFQTLLARMDQTPTDEQRWEVLRMLVSSPGIADNPVVSQMHARLLRHRTVLDSLTLGGFGAAGGSPEVRRMEELIGVAEQELTSAIRSHVLALDARAVALQELAVRTDAALASIPPQLAQGERLAEVVSTYQKLSDQLREEYQRARMSEEVSVGQADIIDLAGLPYEPAPRFLFAKMGLGLLLGLTFGGAGALAVEHRRRSVNSKEELEETFRLPVLAVIPESSDPVIAERKPQLVFDNTPDEETPSSSTAYAREAYRMLCTNLFFAGWTEDVRTISITSTVPQEGKTLTAANLAVSMAGEGIQVLLVDADIWRGRIHEIFGVPVGPGLGEVLRGDISPVATVRESGVPGLWLLPRGDCGPSPSLLTRTSPLQTALDGLGRHFDIVLVDGPPVLAAGSAPALAAVTDGVLLMVQAGRTDRDSVEEALKELNTVGAHLLGAILNDPGNVTGVTRQQYHYYQYATT